MPRLRDPDALTLRCLRGIDLDVDCARAALDHLQEQPEWRLCRALRQQDGGGAAAGVCLHGDREPHTGPDRPEEVSVRCSQHRPRASAGSAGEFRGTVAEEASGGRVLCHAHNYCWRPHPVLQFWTMPLVPLCLSRSFDWGQFCDITCVS